MIVLCACARAVCESELRVNPDTASTFLWAINYFKKDFMYVKYIYQFQVYAESKFKNDQ